MSTVIKGNENLPALPIDLEDNVNQALDSSCRKLSQEIFAELDRVMLKLTEMKSSCSELRSKLDDSFGRNIMK